MRDFESEEDKDVDARIVLLSELIVALELRRRAVSNETDLF